MAMIQKKTTPRTSRPSGHIAEDERRDLNLATKDRMSQHTIDFGITPDTEVVSGATSQLSQQGYIQVIRTQSKYEMMNYARRVVQDLNLKIVREDGLRDMIATRAKRKYTDDQSYDGFVDELKKEASKPCGFVMSKDMKKTFGGRDAPLTEDGYRSIVALQNTSEMAQFVDRVVKDQGYYVVSRDGMNGFVPFHSCEKSSASLEHLENDVRGVAANPEGWASVANVARAASNASHDRPTSFMSSSTEVMNWALEVGIGTSAPITESGYQQVAEMNSNVQMGIFALRAIRRLGLEVVDEDRFHGMIPFYSGERSVQSLAKLHEEIKSVSQDLCAWIVERGWQDDEEVSGRNAPLTEEGYRMIARKRNPSEMSRFVSRVLNGMRMHLTSKAGLHGFLPYFDCEKGAQSLTDLQAEIEASAKHSNSWVAMGPSRQLDLNGDNDDEEEELPAEDEDP